MKKITSLILSFTIMLALIAVAPLSASAETDGDYNYSVLDDGTAMITAYTGLDSDVFFPSSVGGYTVSTIGSSVFRSSGVVVSAVVIPDTVTCIRGGAFEGCSSLVGAFIPASVKIIGSDAFKRCYNLANITIPDSVTIVGDDAFRNCTNLTKAVIGSSLIKISECMFADCSCLSEVTFLDSSALTEIDDFAFQDCSSLKKIDIPDSVARIGESAFIGCSELADIHVPSSLSEIGNAAFYETVWGAGFEEPGLHYVGKVVYQYQGEYDFYGNNEPVDIEIAPGTVGIAAGAFRSRNIRSVTIPGSVTNIGEYAFADCDDLEAVNFPDSVKSVGRHALDNTKWWDDQPDGLIYTGKLLYSYKGECPEAVNAAPGTVAVSDYAFINCEELKSVTLPGSVTSIGTRAFCYCESLEEINIPETVSFIGAEAFMSTAWLNAQPDGPVYTGGWLYRYKGNTPSEFEVAPGTAGICGEAVSYDKFLTPLKKITIPESVTYIDDGAFPNFDELTICAKSGTAAEQYAYIHNFRFEKLRDFKTGDANLDGVVDVRDVTAIQRHIAEFELLTDDGLLAADVNGDGELTVEDVTLLQRYLAEFDVQLA